jgi:hypothetical protein
MKSREWKDSVDSVVEYVLMQLAVELSSMLTSRRHTRTPSPSTNFSPLLATSLQHFTFDEILPSMPLTTNVLQGQQQDQETVQEHPILPLM